MKKFLRVLPLVLVYIAIVYFSIKKPSGNPPKFQNIDKVQHFIAYAALGFFVCFSTGSKKLKIFLISVSFGLGFALEYIQGQLPYRDMSLADGIANTLGLLIGILAFNMLLKMIKGKKVA